MVTASSSVLVNQYRTYALCGPIIGTYPKLKKLQKKYPNAGRQRSDSRRHHRRAKPRRHLRRRLSSHGWSISTLRGLHDDALIALVSNAGTLDRVCMAGASADLHGTVRVRECWFLLVILHGAKNILWSCDPRFKLRRLL